MVLTHRPSLDEADAAPSTTADSPRLLSPTQWWTAIAVVSGVQLLVRWWTAIGLDQYHDDLLISYRALDSPLNADYLLTMYDGHWGPVVAALHWLTVRANPFDAGTAFLVAMVLLMVSNLGVALMLREWLKPRPVVVGIFVFWAATPIMTTVLASWSIALNLLPIAAGMAWTAYAHARAIRSGSRRDASIALLLLGALLLTSPRALVAIPFLVLTTLAYSHLFTMSALDLVRRRRGYWLGMGGATLAYVLAYVLSGPERNSQPVTWSSFAQAADQVVARTAFPALIGGPWTSETGAVPSFGELDSLTTSFVVQVVMGLVVLTIAVRRTAWRAWAILATLIVLHVAVLATAIRFDILGASLLRQPRYLLPLLVPAVLLVGLALTQGTVRPWVASAVARWRWLPTAALIAATLVLVESAWLTTYVQATAMKDASTRQFWLNVRESFAQNPDAHIVQRNMPDSVLASAFLPDLGTISEGLRYFVTEQTFGGPGTDLQYLRDDGVLVPAEVEPYAFSFPGPDGDCGYLIEGNEIVRIPMGKSTFNYGWGVEAKYLAGGDTTLIATASGVTTEIPVPGGLGSVVWVNPGIIDDMTLQLANPSDPSVCVSQIVVGGIVPSE